MRRLKKFFGNILYTIWQYFPFRMVVVDVFYYFPKTMFIMFSLLPKKMKHYEDGEHESVGLTDKDERWWEKNISDNFWPAFWGFIWVVVGWACIYIYSH